MIRRKIWLLIISVVGLIGLPLPHGRVASQPIIDDIYAIAWSSDGLQVATGHALGTVRVWDAATGTLLNTFAPPVSSISIENVDWHPNGTRLAVGATSSYGGAYLWIVDAKTGETLLDLSGGGMGHDVAWSPAGTLLANPVIENMLGSRESIKYKVNVWDVATERLVAELAADSVIFAVDWGPDGSRLASASIQQIIIWDTATWTPLVQMGEIPNISTYAMDWNPDGSQVASTGIDGLAYIWDAATGELVRTLHSPDDSQLFQIAWQPDGKLLVGRSHHALTYWDATTGQEIDRMETTGNLGCIAWSPNGSQLLYGDNEVEYPQVAQIPDPVSTSPAPPNPPPTPLTVTAEAELFDAAWSPDGDLLAVAGAWGVHFFTTDLQEVPSLALPAEEVNALDWRPDGRQLAGGLNDGTIRIWSRAPSDGTFSADAVLDTGHQWVSEVRWSPDGASLAVLGNDQDAGWLDPAGYATVWDASTWAFAAELPGPLVPPANRLTWSPDGAYLAGGGTTNEMTKGCALCAPGHSYGITYLADATTGQTVQVIPGLPIDVGADFEWNAAHELAIAYYGFTVYDTASGQAVPTSAGPLAHREYYSRIAWSPDGHLLAGANQSTVDLVDSHSGTILADNLAAHFDSIEALAWHPDGSLLAVIGRDGLIALYDVSQYVGPQSDAPVPTP